MKCDYPACANEREEGDLYCISHNRKYTCFPVPESAAPSPGNREQALRDALHNAIGDCCFGRDGTLVSWLRAPKDVEDYLYEKLSAALAAQGDSEALREQNRKTVWLVELFSPDGKSEGWWTKPSKDNGGWRTENAWAAGEYTESEAKAVAAALDYFPVPFRWSHWVATEHIFVKNYDGWQHCGPSESKETKG